MREPAHYRRDDAWLGNSSLGAGSTPFCQKAAGTINKADRDKAKDS